MGRNIIKYLAKEIKYNLIGMNMLIKIIFIIECIAISIYSLGAAQISDEGLENQYIIFIAITISTLNEQYNFGKDVFRMLPLSKEEYQWILILEGIPQQFIMSLVVALFTFPAVIIKRDFSDMVILFVVLLTAGLWIKHIDGISNVFKYLSVTKSGKRWLYIIMEWMVSFLYLGVAVFSMMTEMNAYLSVLLSLLFIFIILTGVAIIRKHYMQQFSH
ncbi:MAG: hypothetical protein K2N51_11535 [Lachnospiraceae bacterium]|nr:hypothetical protein [Lachnospiraceae bacterium]